MLQLVRLSPFGHREMQNLAIVANITVPKTEFSCDASEKKRKKNTVINSNSLDSQSDCIFDAQSCACAIYDLKSLDTGEIGASFVQARRSFTSVRPTLYARN